MKDSKFLKFFLVVVVLILLFVVLSFLACNFFKDDKVLKGDFASGEINSGESDITENKTKGEDYDGIKSGINGRVENDGYDESKILYKSYDGTKNVEKFVFTNITVGKINGSRCLFLADIKNDSMEFQKSIKVRISVLDEDDEVKETFSGILNELAGQETGKFKAQVLSDISYAKDFKIEVVNEWYEIIWKSEKTEKRRKSKSKEQKQNQKVKKNNRTI